MNDELPHQYKSIAEDCVECGLCQKNCLFLKKYGTPKQIAGQGLNGQELLAEVFECSLCSLCTGVCTKDIDPGSMFHTMRKVAREKGYGDHKEHRGLLSYERWGISPFFSWYGLPEGCDTVFFPGCAMAGTRSGRVVQLYEYLRQTIPTLGMVLDCCTKPSHDLGRVPFFSRTFAEVKKSLTASGIKNILVACPSCYRVWHDYGEPISVRTIYEYLAETGLPTVSQMGGKVTVHDPCAVREDVAIHQAVRQLVSAMGLEIVEMEHRGSRTVCCGEGGAAGYIVPHFARNWTNLRAQEADGLHIITYCAGCTHFLGGLSQTDHVTDLMFDPEVTLSRGIKATRSPMTWIKRLLLKKKMPGMVRPGIVGWRNRKAEIVMKRQ